MLTVRSAFLLFAISIVAHKCFAKNTGKVITIEYEYILTHMLTPAGPVPTALDANGVMLKLPTGPF